MSVWAASPLGVVVRHLFCGCPHTPTHTPGICCPLRFQNYPQTHQWEEFLLFGNVSSLRTPFPGRNSIPSSFVFLFVFYILSYLLSKRMGFNTEGLVSSASIQKLFCGSCLAFKWSFDEFVGEKVVSPSYYSAILGPPPLQTYLKDTSHFK